MKKQLASGSEPFLCALCDSAVKEGFAQKIVQA